MRSSSLFLPQMHETFGAQYVKYLLLGFSYSHPFILAIKFLSAVAYGCNISLVVIGVRVRSLAVVPGFHLGGGGCRTGVHIGDGGAAVFGGQARHAAEAVVGVVGGDGTLRRLGQPVILVIGIGLACCPDVADKRRPRPSAGILILPRRVPGPPGQEVFPRAAGFQIACVPRLSAVEKSKPAASERWHALY